MSNLLDPEEKTVMAEDYVRIAQKLVAEGFTGEIFKEELKKRIQEYDKFLNERITQFIQELNGESIPEENLNGLEIFFNDEANE